MPVSLPQTERRRADLIIENALVVTMDADFRIIPEGAVAVANGEIIMVADTEAVRREFNADRVMDAGRQVLIPGLVNAHTHAPMTIFRGFADDMPLKEWLYEHIFPVESAFVTAENVRLGTRLAVAEMIRSGTTLFYDMYYHAREVASVADEAGIRAVLTESCIDFPAPNNPTPGHCLATSEEMIQDYLRHPRISFGTSVHSVYSAAPEVYRRARDLAGRYGAPWTTHLAETRWEFDLIMEKYGVTPTRYLADLGVLDDSLTAAHAVHLTPADMDLLAEHGVGVAHNPQCNMKLSSGRAPVPELIARGVRVGLGTDGVASNNDLDLFDEMRSCALLHKLETGDPTVMDARTVLEAATLGGASLMGMEDKVGSLEEGKRADMVLVDLKRPHTHPMYNVYSLLVYSLKGSDVDTVVVDGQVLMENRKLLTIDEQDLFGRVEQLARQIMVRWPGLELKKARQIR